eukprot:GHVH01003770.1.p1 GENE.GHVH01003770.1~~GHVH01003770.1.p1  ORF type:complete len:408 (-),score=51.26 GHVH01003770.1:253-1476(-)
MVFQQLHAWYFLFVLSHRILGDRIENDDFRGLPHLDITKEPTPGTSSAIWHADDDLGDQKPLGDTIPDEVVIVGDIHGDYILYRLMMQECAIIDSKESKWIDDPGAVRYLVQLGDIVDRGPRSKEAYSLTESMRSEAQVFGDHVFSLMGNHEAMIMCGHMQYFSPEELNNFYDGSYLKAYQDFSTTGLIGAAIRTHYQAAIKLSDVLFVHAGFDDLYRDMNFTELKEEALDLIDHHNCDQQYNGGLNALSPQGPFWTRRVSAQLRDHPESTEICGYVDGILENYNANMVVVGHTPTNSGNIESYCDNKWLLHDSGLSRWMMGQPKLSILYQTKDRLTGTVLPLSKWVQVMWYPASGSSIEKGINIVGAFINDGGMDISEKVDFLKAKKEHFTKLKSMETPSRQWDEL